MKNWSILLTTQYQVPLIEGGSSYDILDFSVELLLLIRVIGLLLVFISFGITFFLTKCSTIETRRIMGVSGMISAIIGIILILKSNDLLAFFLHTLIP